MAGNCKRCGKELTIAGSFYCFDCYRDMRNERKSPSVAQTTYQDALECGESIETANREAHYADAKAQGKIGYYAD